VYDAEIPHYFRHVFTDERSVAPRVEYASGLGGTDPKCVVSIVGCTDDWFGGWDGLTPGSADPFITEDLQTGRLVDVIARGEPAVLVCHWPGIYYNGDEVGFRIFQEVVRRLHRRYGDGILWLKPSEIARYWAAKELTRIERQGSHVDLHAPFAAPRYTIAVGTDGPAGEPVRGVRLLVGEGGEATQTELRRVAGVRELTPQNWCHGDDGSVVACFDLPRGASALHLA
jgi:hypothetical protein